MIESRRSVPSAIAPDVLLLQALAWICSKPATGERFLAITGLDSEALRNRAGEPCVLNAVADFLAAHEPDLLDCAEQLSVKPAALAAARL